MEAAEPVRRQVILVVDDEEDILASLKDLIEASLDDVEVVTAPSADDAVAAMRKGPVDLIISDYKMPGRNGLEFLQQARDLAPKVPRFMMTAFPDMEIAIRAINDARIENFFTKPLEPEKVVDIIRAALTERSAQRQRDRAFARSLDLLRRGKAAA